MTAPAPLGPLTTPLAKLAELVAESPTFRARCGLAANDADAAQKLIDEGLDGKRHIFYPAAEAPIGVLHHLFPVAVIERVEGWKATIRSGGAQNYLRPQGTLRLILADNDRYAGDAMASLRDFDNFAGQVLRDAMDVAAKDGRLALYEIREEQPPVMPTEEEEASVGRSWWMASYLIDWN